MENSPAEISLNYSDQLSIQCRCQGIPKPDITWLVNSELNLFRVIDMGDQPNAGACHNTMQTAKELTWADGTTETRYLADDETVTCACANGVGVDAEASSKLNVQCTSNA